ncbi:hypothetical protein L9W92_18335 [Pelotomaculum terephthalicicum JT]|uniref:hypothetical protein n=1 Tax=Pelotomaculum terephthalicicum TaxID=206393 RepID=UPI001F038D32|nr:hypothetical protein [Pelotomaculum terephthalicicum]MCG9969955.1 hypothetical protein [Pelotomaculum terephthalicicum JT]
MEIIKRGVKTKRGKTFYVGDVLIKNVIVPSSEEERLNFNLMAKKTVKKCGIRPFVTYYPVPPEVGINKKMVPFFLFCVARFREEMLRRGG